MKNKKKVFLLLLLFTVNHCLCNKTDRLIIAFKRILLSTSTTYNNSIIKALNYSSCQITMTRIIVIPIKNENILVIKESIGKTIRRFINSFHSSIVWYCLWIDVNKDRVFDAHSIVCLWSLRQNVKSFRCGSRSMTLCSPY